MALVAAKVLLAYILSAVYRSRDAAVSGASHYLDATLSGKPTAAQPYYKLYQYPNV